MRNRLIILVLCLIFFSCTDARAEGFFYDADERNPVQLNTGRLDLLQKKGIRMASVREVTNPYRGNKRLYVPCPLDMVNFDGLKPNETAMLRRGFAYALAESAEHRLDAIYFLQPKPQKEADIPPFARLSFMRGFPYTSDLDQEIKSLKEIFTPQEVAKLTAFAAGKKPTLDKALLNKVTDKITSGPGLQFVLAYSMDEVLGDDVIALTVLSLDGWTFGAGDHTSVTATARKYFYWPKPKNMQSAEYCYSYMQGELATVPGVFKKLETSANNWVKGFYLANP